MATFNVGFLRKAKIATQLLFWFIVLEFSAESVLTFISYRNAESSLREQITNGLNAIATRQANQISNYLSTQTRTVTALSRSPDLIAATLGLAQSFRQFGGAASEHKKTDSLLRPTLVGYQQSFQYANLLLVSTTGEVVFSAKPTREFGTNLNTGEFKATELAKVVSRAAVILQTEISDFASQSGMSEPSAFLAAPITQGGKTFGVLVAQIDNSEINKVVNDYTGLGRTGETVLVSRFGNEAVFTTNTRNSPDAAFKKKIEIGSSIAPAIQEAVQGRGGDGTITDYRGIEALAVWSYVPALRSGLVVKIDTAEAFEPIARLRTILIVIISATLVLVVIGAITVARSLTKPVLKLTEVTKKIAAGDLDQKIEIPDENEIGELANSFNKMTLSLKKSQADLQEYNRTLEQRVEERTKELKESQAQLIQSEKMAALGQMVAGVAHEVNTPLGFVRNNIVLMSRKKTKISEVLQKQQALVSLLTTGDLEQAEQAIMDAAMSLDEVERKEILKDIDSLVSDSLGGLERIQELVVSLKNFSRLDEAAFKLTDVNEGIESTLVIATNVLKTKVDVVKNLTPNFIIECYPSQLNQVFLNLFINAAQAIETKGTLTITTKFDERDRNWAIITVADTGKGIPPNIINRIFEPFFTTKAVGQGTGLGLSIVYKIIEKHNGSISVQSTVGKGTEFTIRIPVRQTAAALKAAETSVETVS